MNIKIREAKQMKQFNYDLLENKKHLLEQDNSGSDRVYHGNGTLCICDQYVILHGNKTRH